MSQPIMKLYSRAWCGWCDEAKAWLDNHGFEYENVDIGLDPAAEKEMIKLSQQTRVPTIVINEDLLADFDTKQLETFLTKLGHLSRK